VGRRQQHEKPDEARIPHSRRGEDSGCGSRVVEPAHDEARYLLLGVTSGGRHAALIFTRRGDKLRPITCRAMRKKEREVYDAAT
jgi:hypothetical protein